jgi:hypothetical protein
MLNGHFSSFPRRVQRRISPFSCVSGRSFTFDPKKFASVLSFHDGIAAVRTWDGSAFHVDRAGKALYSARFARTFGYYAAERAAVIDHEANAFHIDLEGNPAYPARYAWCGNYASTPLGAQAPVRDTHDRYFVIDEQGDRIGGPYLYAGDPNSAGNRVVWDFEGKCSIVSSDGSAWATNSQIAETWIDASVPHKGTVAKGSKSYP